MAEVKNLHGFQSGFGGVQEEGLNNDCEEWKEKEETDETVDFEWADFEWEEKSGLDEETDETDEVVLLCPDCDSLSSLSSTGPCEDMPMMFNIFFIFRLRALLWL